MKTYFFKSIFFFLVLLFSNEIVNAQVNTNGTIANNITNENPFLDASSNFDNSLDPTGNGKGLLFPTTDLTTFTFNTTTLFAGGFPSGLDGMIVYNATTGNTLAAVNGNNGIVTAVTPGYYYYYNPGGFDSITAGKWTPLGSSGIKNYSTTEVATSTSIAGKQVYAIKGSFQAGGINALVTIPKPLGMTGYYKMTTYQNGRTFRSEISSFDIDPLLITNNVVTGNGLFTEVYPSGDYTYTLEYFKS